MTGREGPTRPGASTAATAPPADTPVRKCMSTWHACNRRRWLFEKELADGGRVAFVCECTSGECHRAVELTLLEFEAAHICPGWTAVIPGHLMDGDGSRVVSQYATFWVVELYPLDAEGSSAPA